MRRALCPVRRAPCPGPCALCQEIGYRPSEMAGRKGIMTVPFVDLRAQYESIREEIQAGIERVLTNTAFILGPEVQAFEEEFAAYCGAAHCVALNSGTSALHLALLACGVGPGDEVITVPNTYVATVEAICYTGARPVFVDVDPETYNLAVDRVEAAITERTKVLLPVHLYGQPAEMEPLMDMAHRHGLTVVEDCAQAHGAELKCGLRSVGCGDGNPRSEIRRRVGTFGRVGCFSFYPGKNLGAYGEAGAVVTNDGEVADRIRALRDHGQKGKHRHVLVGYNYRMEGLQGAVLRAKLPHLEAWTEARRAVARRYNERLKGTSVVTPAERENVRHVYHLYVVRSKERDALQDHLNARGVATGLHYPTPIHLQEGYRFLRYREGAFPVAEQAAKEILSLPMYAELTEAQVEYVAQCIHEFRA